MTKLFCLFVILILAACNNKETYEVIQGNQRYECQKEPNPTVREDCLKGLNTSYEEYERARSKN